MLPSNVYFSFLSSLTSSYHWAQSYSYFLVGIKRRLSRKKRTYLHHTLQSNTLQCIHIAATYTDPPHSFWWSRYSSLLWWCFHILLTCHSSVTHLVLMKISSQSFKPPCFLFCLSKVSTLLVFMPFEICRNLQDFIFAKLWQRSHKR